MLSPREEPEMAKKTKTAVSASGSNLTFMANPADLGAAIRAARVAKGMTQDGLADRAKVSRQFIIHLEEGKENAHLAKVLKTMACVGLVGIMVPADAVKGAKG
jgi:DNA-binding XRE family transcriptional regulator